jgi:hypothetical protein
MSIQHYAVIDASNNIINRIVYASEDTPPIPHPYYSNHTLIPCDDTIGLHIDGWKYVNGKFIAPPPPPPAPTLPSDPKDKQIADLKADIQTLSASLTQVINTLNNLTRPSSAGKNTSAK